MSSHLSDYQYAGADDDTLFAHAQQEGVVFVSTDKDFCLIVATNVSLYPHA